MNSDDDEAFDKILGKILDALQRKYPPAQLTCDFCSDENSYPVYVNMAQDSAICWSCVNEMQKRMLDHEWLRSINWDELSRH